jgi:flagellar biosynthesis protein
MNAEQDAHYRRKRAVALRYRRGEDSAPVVVAKGAGTLAERILEIAREYEIPLYEDPDLVEVLAKIDLGNVIPPELYQAVAEVLAFVYNLNRKMLDEQRAV